MDKKTLVEKIRQVVKDFSNGRGDYSLVMLIPDDPAALNSKVALLISATWLDEESAGEVIYEIIILLREVLGVSETVHTIGGIVPARTSDPTVKAINSAYIVTDDETVELINVNAAGRQLDKATILESRQLCTGGTNGWCSQMDKKTLAEKIRQVVKDFSNGRGEYSLVMLIPNDPAALDSKVALLISAPWLDEESTSEVIHDIILRLREVLGVSETVHTIGGIVPARTSDPTVKAINSAYIVTDNETVELINVNAAGRQLDKATILESRQL